VGLLGGFILGFIGRVFFIANPGSETFRDWPFRDLGHLVMGCFVMGHIVILAIWRRNL
jgi:H+/Cl- antiporter ClcA